MTSMFLTKVRITQKPDSVEQPVRKCTAYIMVTMAGYSMNFVENASGWVFSTFHMNLCPQVDRETGMIIEMNEDNCQEGGSSDKYIVDDLMSHMLFFAFVRAVATEVMENFAGKIDTGIIGIGEFDMPAKLFVDDIEQRQQMDEGNEGDNISLDSFADAISNLDFDNL